MEQKLRHNGIIGKEKKKKRKKTQLKLNRQESFQTVCNSASWEMKVQGFWQVPGYIS